MKPVQQDFIWIYLVNWFRWVLRWAEGFTASRWWLLKAWILFLLFSIFLSGGIATAHFYTAGYTYKVEHPFADVTKIYERGSHDEKLNFRITMPIILHVLGLTGKRVMPTLTTAAIALVPLLSAWVAWRMSNSRVLAVFIGLNVACTYVGSFGVIGYFDAICWCQLALACLPGIPWILRAALCFTCSFTDERGFLAFGFVCALSVMRCGASGGMRRFFNRDTISLAISILLFIAARLWLQFGLGMHSSWKGVGPNNVAMHIAHLHPGIWYGLEGGWVFVFLSCVSLVVRRQYFRLFIFLIPLSGVLAAAYLDGDLMRSTTFLFPALFVALYILCEHESASRLTIYALVAFGLSVFGGNYNVFLGKITWFMPLPIQWLDAAMFAFVQWLKRVMHYDDGLGDKWH